MKLKHILLIAMATVAILLAIFNPVDYWFWPKCPVKLLTGLSCPGCGIQRFFHALCQGEVARALSYNYYLVYSLPYAAALVVTYYLPTGPTKARWAHLLESRPAITLYVASFFVWFVVRNLLHI